MPNFDKRTRRLWCSWQQAEEAPQHGAELKRRRKSASFLLPVVASATSVPTVDSAAGPQLKSSRVRALKALHLCRFDFEGSRNTRPLTAERPQVVHRGLLGGSVEGQFTGSIACIPRRRRRSTFDCWTRVRSNGLSARTARRLSNCFQHFPACRNKPEEWLYLFVSLWTIWEANHESWPPGLAEFLINRRLQQGVCHQNSVKWCRFPELDCSCSCLLAVWRTPSFSGMKRECFGLPWNGETSRQ